MKSIGEKVPGCVGSAMTVKQMMPLLFRRFAVDKEKHRTYDFKRTDS